MGLFKKKSDPISERAKALSAQIAALEAQIKELSDEENNHHAPAFQPSVVEPPPAPAVPHPTPVPPPSQPAQAAPQPRLRSTTIPHSRQTGAATHHPREPVFEEVDHARIQAEQEGSGTERQNELDVRKSDLPALWQRVKTHFRGPPTSNPKLVNYLAAGSIQGLRPLRYERRVARNRFIVLVICLVLVLWGLIAIFWKGHR